MISATPLVSVVIPTRNEEADITRCLDAVLDQDWPHERLEILLVDGTSSDRTTQRAKLTLKESDLDRWEVLSNAVGSTPSNLNLGLQAARGTYVVRVDARARIPRDYVRRCVELLTNRPDIVVVGGRQRAVPPMDGAYGEGIARALNNPYTMGLSRYRRGVKSGQTDTVYLGSFRTDQLRSVGGWDNRFHTNQDFELNRRLKDYGAIWFESDMDVEYVPRSSVGALFRQFHRFGRWKVRYWRLSGDLPRARQILMLFLPLGMTTLVVFGWPTSADLVVAFLPLLLLAIRWHPRSTTVPMVMATAAVATGWTSGVWREALSTFFNQHIGARRLST